MYLLPHLGWIAARAPNRENRAHGPTKEDRQNLGNFWIFPAHGKNDPGRPLMGRGRLFRHKKISPTFWAERILILRTFDFWSFLGSQIFGLGPLGPHVGPPTLGPIGPTHFGPHVGPPTWAHPLGPHVGPPTLGPDAAAGRILRSQPDPSPNAPRDQIRRKDPCCDN